MAHFANGSPSRKGESWPGLWGYECRRFQYRLPLPPLHRPAHCFSVMSRIRGLSPLGTNPPVNEILDNRELVRPRSTPPASTRVSPLSKQPPKRSFNVLIQPTGMRPLWVRRL